MGKNEGRTLLFLAITTSMLLSIFAIAPTFAQATTIGVEPDSIINSTLQGGSTFTVEVWVRSVVNLYGVEFKLGYNTAILTATLIEYGGIFGDTYFLWTSTINDPGGYLHYSISPPLDGGSAFTGNGRVAIITFTVDSYGSCPLDLYDTNLGDDIVPPNPIEHTAIDGWFDNRISGDANSDKTVNVFDILAVKSRWGRTPASSDWIREYDVNYDDAINVFDILTVKANWGQTAP